MVGERSVLGDFVRDPRVGRKEKRREDPRLTKRIC